MNVRVTRVTPSTAPRVRKAWIATSAHVHHVTVQLYLRPTTASWVSCVVLLFHSPIVHTVNDTLEQMPLGKNRGGGKLQICLREVDG